MAEHLKVKGYTGLVRDVYSSAIVREKSTDFKMYMQRQTQIRENKDEMRNAIREINNLKKELREIKELLVKKVNN
tara:strand:+ start:194 stop:418 length:225 start_codon:yes stop_codon:yes gene_type:complete